MQGEVKEHYIVLGKTIEAPNVSTLTLALVRGGIPQFTAGQFITVYFPDAGTPEGKAYSISSAPDESSLSITVRAIGKFSNRLCALRPGDMITASLPYGYFSSEDETSPLILLAAGIGITPFRSIIQDSMKKNPKRKIALFYTGRSIVDMVFKNEFNALKESHQNFTTHYFVTRENNVPTDTINRRMRAEDIINTIDDLNSREFLICGAIPFVSDLWRSLNAGGVPADMIYTEAFFSH